MGPPSFTLSASPSTITQKQGTLGSSIITVTSTNYEGSVIFTVASDNPAVLANGCYAISNTTVTTNGVSYTTLTVYTAQAECDVPSDGQDFGVHHLGPDGRSAPRRLPPGLPAPIKAAALGGLMLIGLRRSRSKLWAIFGSLLLVVALGGSGCGSGPAVVPRGTYTLTVTGTDTVNPSLTASTAVTLVVD